MKTGFIGGGKMAEAVIVSLIGSKHATAHEVFVSDISPDRRALLKKDHGINVYSRNRDVVGAADVVFLAVKPQDLDEILTEIAPDVTPNHLVISIAAGKRIARMESILPEARVVRVMPNLPCTVREGMSVYCLGSRATAADGKLVKSLLSSCGRVLELPEERFDVVTALSGSGPAFFAYVLHCMVDAGVLGGLERADALLLAEQTMQGTSRLLQEKGLDPMDLVKSVASARGTTAAGLEVLDHSALGLTIQRTIQAATNRSRELSQ